MIRLFSAVGLLVIYLWFCCCCIGHGIGSVRAFSFTTTPNSRSKTATNPTPVETSSPIGRIINDEANRIPPKVDPTTAVALKRIPKTTTTTSSANGGATFKGGAAAQPPPPSNDKENKPKPPPRGPPPTNAIPSIPSLDPTIAIPERFVDFANNYFSAATSTTTSSDIRPNSKYIWVDQFDSDAQQEDTTVTTTTTTTTSRRPFSLLSWNILAQSLYEKGLPAGQPPLSWSTRLEWIISTLQSANADIICLQEVQDEHVFAEDLLPALQNLGYDGICQGAPEGVREIKRRKGKGERAHLVATFWKRDLFEPALILPENVNVNSKKNNKKKPKKNKNKAQQNCMAHMARGRTLTSILHTKQLKTAEEEDDNQDNNGGGGGTATLAVVNCHLEGHPNQYAARIRQLQHALDDLATRVETPTTGQGNDDDNTSSVYNGLVIAGDFNCELSSSACSTYLRIGRVGRKGGLGGVHGTAALSVPPAILESDEAAEVLSPIMEWGNALPNNEMESVKPHPFRRNSLVSAYPAWLQPNVHFTYCAKPFRPVSGLDQIWFSSLSLTRKALRRSTSSPTARNIILQTGLPEGEILNQPSDHLPIGALFEWNSCNPTVAEECPLEFSDDGSMKTATSTIRKTKCSDGGIRSLIVVPDHVPPPPKPVSPIMAYTELDILLSTCVYDSDDQRQLLEEILEQNLPSNTDQKPTEAEIIKLRELRDRKKTLLQQATERVRPTIQRILKLKKEVAKYEEEMFGGFA